MQGTLYFIDVLKGASLRATGLANIDQDPIVAINGNVYLQHFVVGTSSGMIRIFNTDRVCVNTMYLGLPILGVSFLNDHGDLLVAMPMKLVAIVAEEYSGQYMEDRAPKVKKPKDRKLSLASVRAMMSKRWVG